MPDFDSRPYTAVHDIVLTYTHLRLGDGFDGSGDLATFGVVLVHVHHEVLHVCQRQKPQQLPVRGSRARAITTIIIMTVIIILLL